MENQGFFDVTVDMGYDEVGSKTDSDGDLIDDVRENELGTDPDNIDSDSDGLIDGIEVYRGTNPSVYNIPEGIAVPDSKYHLIQQAITEAFPSETITVFPGVYNENIHFMGKDVVLTSINPEDEETRNNTIIDGRSLGSVITFNGLETSDCLISGFTMRNGSAASGGGINGNKTQSTIRNNIISNNTSYDAVFYDEGGGIAYCNGLIECNIIRDNSSENCGGGIAICDGIIQSNVIHSNYARCYGGGIFYCDASILNNTIVENSCSLDSGGGLYECDRTVRNNIIWGNMFGENSDQIYNLNDDYDRVSYCCIQDWSEGGTGNISSDPKFVGSGDFHLLGDSPCIDSGGEVSIFEDIEGNPRPMDASSSSQGDGSDFDMGSYEYSGTVLPTYTPSYTPTLTPTRTPTTITETSTVTVTPTFSSNLINIPADILTIQDGINCSSNGSIIVVSPGVYYENIDFLGKNITLRSTDPDDPEVVASTVIDGASRDTVVIFSGAESDECILEGFTIINGKSDNGGGIRGNGTYATIRNNIITNNSGRYGGGIYKCNGLINSNKILYNAVSGYSYGGGLYKCNGTISNNVISENLGWKGGGVFDSDGLIFSNIISINRTNADGRGGGLNECDGIIMNNVIYGNTSNNSAGGIYYCKGTIINCIIWANTRAGNPSQLSDSVSPFFSCVQGLTEGTLSNIWDDPRFVDPENGDFHLQADSPCIDIGYMYCLPQEFLVDMDGECRIAGNSVDIGCDEFDSSLDSDGDLLSDTDEELYGSNPNIMDTDGDGLIDGVEVIRGTEPDMLNVPLGISIRSDYATIQEGIFIAFPTEKITVESGTYEDIIWFNGKNVVLQSSDFLSKGNFESTIIDGNGIYSVINFLGSEDETCVLRGFTVQNGEGKYGGGIRGNGANALIESNLIVNNKADYGGGIWDIDGIIRNNAIILNDTFVRVQYGYDYGGSIQNCDGTIYNNSIVNNLGIGLKNCNGTIRNCIVWDNSDNQLTGCSIPDYSCIEDWSGGGSLNLNIDPQIFHLDLGNFHLLSDSPCIDAGEEIFELLGDIDGNNRPIDGTSEQRGDLSDYDMGADEFVGVSPYNNPPNKPVNLSPANNDPDQTYIPTLICSEFSDPDVNDYHIASQWQIDATGDFSSPQFDSGVDIYNKTDITIEPGILTLTKTYYWRVRHIDSFYTLGEWSDPIKFIVAFINEFQVPEEFSTIQKAINSATHGVEIIVSPGVYRENINFKGKNILLRSTDPSNPDVVNETIINGGQNGPVVIFSGKESSDCVLAGFTITNGKALNGGGINGNGTFVTIEYCDVYNNETYRINDDDYTNGNGGGLYECDGVVQNCIIAENYAKRFGGGLYGCDGTIQNNNISDNDSRLSGGGLSYCNALIQYNHIINNLGYYGGGLYECNGGIYNNIIAFNLTGEYSYVIYSWPYSYGASYGGNGGGLYDCDGEIHNNTIYGNIAREVCYMDWYDSGCSGGHGGGLSECNGSIKNCVIWGNTGTYENQLHSSSSVSHCCIGDVKGDTKGNIYEDPKLFDPVGGDFHLTSDSPCIDAGETVFITQDFEGDPRLIGSAYDIGADEFLQNSQLYNPPDKPVNLVPLNGDINVPIPLILKSSSFSDPDDDSMHLGSQWQLGTNLDFSNPFDSGNDSANLTSIKISNILLLPSTTYYWRVRHIDSNYYWSNWSDTTSFTLRDSISIYVPDDFATIQDAIDNSLHYDEIIVDPGIYYENINFNGMNIILRSTEPTKEHIVANTIIDGSHSGSVVTFTGLEISDCILSGFTITNGEAEKGGGINGNGTLAAIDNCIIINNHASSYGGGIYNLDGSISNNIISDNSTYAGGGLHGCDGLITNNNIKKNNVSHYGGGLDNCNGILRRNLIQENSAERGGGLHQCNNNIENNFIVNNMAFAIGGGLCYCQGNIYNNTIYGNSAAHHSGGCHECDGDKINCIIWGNGNEQLYGCSSPIHSCIQDWPDNENGNIADDPMFINSASGDLHLLPSSPCIDSGTAIFDMPDDFDGDARYYGSGYDMGADEYYPYPAVSLSASPIEGLAPLTVNLVGSATTDEGVLTSYYWLFDVDVNSEIYYISDVSVISATDYTYDEPGIYEAQFWAENSFDQARYAIRQIAVWTLTPTPAPTVTPTPHPLDIYDLDDDDEIEMGDLLEFIECVYNNNSRGDFNKDGVVDGLDLFYLSKGWGVSYDK